METNEGKGVPEKIKLLLWDLVNVLREEIRLKVMVNDPSEEEIEKAVTHTIALISTSLAAIICGCCPKELAPKILEIVTNGLEHAYERKKELDLFGG